MSTLRVNTLQNTSTTDGGISIDTSGHVTIDGQVLPSAGPLSNRNLIINGAMQVAQRGSVTGAQSGYGGPDRFTLTGNTAARATLSQSTDVPSGEGFTRSYGIDVTTASGSLAAGAYHYLGYKFEGQDLQHLKKGTSNAESVTLSFWVKSPKTGTHVIQLYDNDNTRHISKSYSVSSADTWQKITLTFEGDTTGAFDNDNNYSLQFYWWLAAGTNYTSGTLATAWQAFAATDAAVGQVNVLDSTDNNFYITGIQLEVGSVATPFEHRSYGDELARCQRYYQLTEAGGGGVCTGSTGLFLNIIYSEMRDAPTIGLSAALTINEASNNFTQSSAGISSQTAGTTGAFLQINNFSGLTQYRPFTVRSPDSKHFTLSSEL